jgi:hypothetical protein
MLLSGSSEEARKSMNAVTVSELAKRILDLLGVKDGEAIDLSKLRDGSVLLRRATES